VTAAPVISVYELYGGLEMCSQTALVILAVSVVEY